MTLKNLQAVLDRDVGPTNKVSSSLKHTQQGFDNQTLEHVYWFEYRVRLRNDPPPRPDPRLVKAAKEKKMALLRDLLSHV
ncbi:MAG: hypothetical protein ACYCZR_08630 [Burkholderiales bacterium]